MNARPRGLVAFGCLVVAACADAEQPASIVGTPEDAGVEDVPVLVIDSHIDFITTDICPKLGACVWDCELEDLHAAFLSECARVVDVPMLVSCFVRGAGEGALQDAGPLRPDQCAIMKQCGTETGALDAVTRELPEEILGCVGRSDAGSGVDDGSPADAGGE